MLRNLKLKLGSYNLFFLSHLSLIIIVSKPQFIEIFLNIEKRFSNLQYNVNLKNLDSPNIFIKIMSFLIKVIIKVIKFQLSLV